jgi:uncharacterized membrane protein HdeD (DUF308 family)
MSLGEFVLAFGTYALVDGVAALAQALWAVDRPRHGAPVLVEGAVSVALGVAAWGWPFAVSPVVLFLVAMWGTITGLLELLAARWLLHAPAARSLFRMAGGASTFLGVVLLLLPRAGTRWIVVLVGLYAVTCGACTVLAASGLRAAKPLPPPEANQAEAA